MVYRVRETLTKRRPLFVGRHWDKVWSVAFSGKPKILASGSEDGLVKLWDLASGQERLAFAGHFNLLQTNSVSPNANI